MAINDAAGMGATGARGRLTSRRSGGPQPCTTPQTDAWSQAAPTMPSADATPSPYGMTASGPAAAHHSQLLLADAAAPEPGAGIAVYVLGEHELVRQGLVDLVDAAPDMFVVGAAGSAVEDLPRIAASMTVVVLLDTQLPDEGEIDRCRQVSAHHPELRCLLLTAFDDDEALFTAVMAGAAGYLVKQIGGGKLLDGIRAVAAGHSLLDATVTERLLGRLRRTSLDEREQLLLELISRGSTDGQIADQLTRTVPEVRTDVTALCDKLALRRREPVPRTFGPGAG